MSKTILGQVVAWLIVAACLFGTFGNRFTTPTHPQVSECDSACLTHPQVRGAVSTIRGGADDSTDTVPTHPQLRDKEADYDFTATSKKSDIPLTLDYIRKIHTPGVYRVTVDVATYRADDDISASEIKNEMDRYGYDRVVYVDSCLTVYSEGEDEKAIPVVATGKDKTDELGIIPLTAEDFFETVNGGYPGLRDMSRPSLDRPMCMNASVEQNTVYVIRNRIPVKEHLRIYEDAPVYIAVGDVDIEWLANAVVRTAAGLYGNIHITSTLLNGCEDKWPVIMTGATTGGSTQCVPGVKLATWDGRAARSGPGMEYSEHPVSGSDTGYSMTGRYCPDTAGTAWYEIFFPDDADGYCWVCADDCVIQASSSSPDLFGSDTGAFTLYESGYDSLPGISQDPLSTYSKTYAACDLDMHDDISSPSPEGPVVIPLGSILYDYAECVDGDGLGWALVRYGDRYGYVHAADLSSRFRIESVINEDNVPDEIMKYAVEQLEYLPDSVWNKFLGMGWKVIITMKDVNANYYHQGYGGIAGVTLFIEKEIAVYGTKGRIDRALLHEFGHFVDFMNAPRYDFATYSSEFSRIYSEEKDAIKFYNQPDRHAYSNPQEYFAEAFYHSLCHPDSTRESAPKTYEYVMRCVDNI